MSEARFFKSNWKPTTTTATPFQEIWPNRYGFRCVSLGPLDEAGDVVITPLVGSMAGQEFRVSARAPLIITHTGPVGISTPFVAAAGTDVALMNHNIDLMFYPCVPGFSPLRTSYVKTIALSSTVDGGWWNIFGRRKVNVFARCTSGTPTLAIQVYMFYGGVNFIREVYNSGALASGNQITFAIDPVNVPTATLIGLEKDPFSLFLHATGVDGITMCVYAED